MMFPAMPTQEDKEERRLTRLFKSLNRSDKDSLVAFGEFLQSRDAGSADNEVFVSEPVEIPRPEKESVIKAIKRLSATYPMVDKETILHPIADLMTSHMVSGRPSPEVIDDLEALFLNEYESLTSE